MNETKGVFKMTISVNTQMWLKPVKNPFKKIRFNLLHKAMKGDEKAQRQLKTLGAHLNNMTDGVLK